MIEQEVMEEKKKERERKLTAGFKEEEFLIGRWTHKKNMLGRVKV